MKKMNMDSRKPDFTEEELVKHLNKVIADPIFTVSNILIRFLSFVVKETLAGRSNQLKEYSIGLGVLKRGSE